MNLVATAETAQDVASGLNKFLEPVAESSTEITRLMSECFAISSALRELSTALREPRHSRSYSIISENLRLAVSSLEYTFDDVGRLCGRIPRTRNSAYRSIWRDIENYFQDESRNSLLARLEYYRRFLQDLLCIILERLALIPQVSRPPSHESTDHLQIGIYMKTTGNELMLSWKSKRPDSRMTLTTCHRALQVSYREGHSCYLDSY